MSISYCPYCNSVQGLLIGHVYCSRQTKPMGELETGTLFIKSKKLEETADHVSRLSIRLNLNGEQHYKVGGRDYLVNPKNYLVVNQGQHYQTSFSSSEEQEMILVAFKPGMVEDLSYSLSSTAGTLLDEPFYRSNTPVHFFEQTYEHDPVIHALFQRLRGLMDADRETRSLADLDSIYSLLLTRLLNIHHDIDTQINRLASSKRSTREELYKRLSIARDYMLAHLSKPIKLEDIAAVACLSVHHFKREFRNLYGVSPHRFLVEKRIDKASGLLKNTSLALDEVCTLTGFQNTSSFIRLFKEFTGQTPGIYRLNSKK